MCHDFGRRLAVVVDDFAIYVKRLPGRIQALVQLLAIAVVTGPGAQIGRSFVP